MSWKLTLFTFILFTLSAGQLVGQGCGESFFDSGGAGGTYQNEEFLTWTFCPDDPGDIVVLDFTFVDVEGCCDVISVFSGSDTSTPINFDVEAPETFFSSAADGCLTVTFDSDFSVTNQGWEATITCISITECGPPISIAAATPTAEGAVISWAQLGTIVDTWDLEFVIAGNMPTGTPTVSGIMDNPYTWTGGESGTEYDVYIRSQCDDGTFTEYIGPATFTTTPECGDNFYDSGGPDGNYQPGESETWTFCPDTPGDIVTLDFTFVNVGDNLSVFSGMGTAVPLNLNVLAPETFISAADDGCITVVWNSGFFGGGGAGWEATINCAPTPPCPDPTMLAATIVTSAGATISWSQIGTVDTWDLEIISAGTIPTGTPNVTDVMDNPYAWTGADSGTSYDVYLRGQCQEGGEFTGWVGPINFTTVPACGDSFFDSGGEFGNYQNNELETYTFCPDNPGDEVTLNFLFVDVESCCDDLSVFNGIGTADPLNLDVEAPESFTSNTADGCLTVTWDSDGSVIRAGWAATVTCNPPPDCPNPTALAVTAATTDGATISWTEEGIADTWNFEIIPAGTMPTGVPNVTDVMDNPFVWTGGESGIAYDVYIQAQCEVEGEFSNWVGPVSFSTVPACGDNFFDPGGVDGQYDNNIFVSYTFCPDNPGEAIILNFSFVDVESCCDDLSIFNGSGTADPINLDVEQPEVFISTAADGCLTVTFDSDGSVIRDGWEASITCSPCIPDPVILTPNVTVGFFDDSSVNILIDLIGLENYEIEFDTLGFELGTGTTLITDDSSLVLTGLDEGTDYEFYITNLCPDGQATIVLGPFPFSTIFSDDVGITEVIAPLDECGLGNGEPVRVAITNFGTNPQTLFPLNYSVNGVAVGISQPVDGFFTGIISRDSSEIFEFDLDYDFDLPGEYIIQVWTEMETDDNLRNDTATVILTRFAPPLFEDFEAGVVPGYITTNFNTAIFAPFAHNNETFVMGANLFGTFNELLIDLPVLGPVNDTDTLFFDYRYVDWQFGDVATTNLTATDFLSVFVSTDCGETFDLAFLQAGTDHEPNIDLRTVAIPMAPFAGENVQIRISGTYGSGGPDYWLDIDNINLPRCDGLGITADVTNSDIGLENGAITATPASGIGPFDYFWNTGETTATITDLPVGQYTVTITDRFGCSDQLMITVDFATSIEDISDIIGEVVLAPNPTPDQSTIRVEFNESVDARVEVVNMLGQPVWQSPLIERVSSINETVDLSQAPAGMYLVRIQAAGQTKVIKLMKS